MSPLERQIIANIPTENLDAYEAYQLGRQALARRSTKSIAEAIDYFTGATTIDPGFAEAWAGLSDAYRTLAHYSGQTEKRRIPWIAGIE